MPAGIPQAGPFDCPGEIATLDNEGYAEGEHPYIRMAAIVRARRLDLRLLLDSYDMHNRGFVDKNTFMRALCHSFGNQWNELQLTNAEFDECTKPFLCREPKRPGDPIANVYWQKFAVHVQALADKSGSVDGTGKAGDY